MVKAGTKEVLLQAPPSDVEAEHCVLGSMLIDPDCIDDVALEIDVHDFYDDANAEAFRAMQYRWNEGGKVDPVLVHRDLEKLEHFENAIKYMAKITDVVPNASHAIHYARLVRATSVRRKLRESAQDIIVSTHSDQVTPEELIAKSEQAIFDIAEKQVREPDKLGDVVINAMESIQERKESGSTGGVATGFAKLDNDMGGLRPGELIVVAARPSMGKTSFALNVAEHAALQDEVCTLFCSLEMSQNEVGERLLCSAARVPLFRARNGTLDQSQMSDIVEASNRIYSGQLWIDDTATQRVSEIAAKARRLKRRYGLGLLIVDYLQLIQPDDNRAQRELQVATMARGLKVLAKQLEIPVVIVAQLNRQTESAKDNRPRLSHLRESGAIEQDADVVMFVHRESYYLHGEEAKEKQHEAQLILSKQRNGPVGDYDLLWHKELSRFEEPAPERHQHFDDYNEYG